MATKIGDLYYDVDADTSGLDKKLEKAGKSAGATGGKATGEAFGKSSAGVISRWAKVVVAGFVARGAFDLVKDTIGQASDLNESITKVEQVFGDASSAVLKWSEDSAQSFGQSQQQALEAAGTYGNLFQAFGLGRDQSQEMSQSLVELAADLASFNNTSVDEALTALRSGLTGETEPMKKYGSVLSDVRLKQKALELGLISSVEDGLDPAAKAQAAYALILDDTAIAQGDFERTSDGLANQQKILGAEWKDAQAQIGKMLLPIVQRFVGFLIKSAIPALKDVAEWTKNAFKWLVENEAVLIGIGAAIATLFAVWAAGAIAAAAPTIAAAAPFIALAIAVAAVTAAVIWAYQNWEWFRTAVDAVGRWFRDVWIPLMLDVWGWLRDNVPPIMQAIADFFTQTLLPAAQTTFTWINDNVVPIFAAIWDFIVTYLLPAFMTYAEFMIGVYKTAIQTAIDVIIVLWGWLQDLWNRSEDLRSFLANAFVIAFDLVKQAVENVITVVTTLWDWFQILWDRSEGLRSFLAAAFWLAVTVVRTAFDNVVSAVTTLWNWLQWLWDKSEGVRGFFADAFKGAIDGIKDAFGFMSDAAGGVIGALQSVIEKAEAMVGPLLRVIELLGKVFGFDGGLSNTEGGGGGVGARGDAAGGPRRAGEAGWVGEQGPEMFVPKTSGYILNASDSAAVAASWGQSKSSGGVHVGSITVQVSGAQDYESAYRGAQEGTLAALGQYIRARG